MAIKKIRKNTNNNERLSIRKITKKLKERGIVISKITVYLILVNELGYYFRKTAGKNKRLLLNNYTIMKGIFRNYFSDV